jgi:hypothetical protein
MQLWLFQLSCIIRMTWLDLDNQNDILHIGYKSKGHPVCMF